MSHHTPPPLRFGGRAVCLSFVCVVGCSGQADFADVQSLSGGDGTAWWETDDDRGRAGNKNDPPEGPRPEVCDGLDNDLDGTTDEELGGTPCTGASGLTGVWQCVAGKLVCYECDPGEANRRGCGCSEDTADVCNDSGRWIAGVCNGCADLDETGCGIDAACEPGEEAIRRCDMCSGSGGAAGCGASCMGALYRCSNTCEWVRIGECKVYDPTCDRDYKYIEECGRCGRREVKCDGCFYQQSDCRDQGACRPGDRYAIPCFGNECRYGWTATATCNQECSWDVGTCQGCTPGTVENVTTLCVAGHAECGDRLERRTCVGQSNVASCDEETITQGIEHNQTIYDDCGGVVAPGFCVPNSVTSEQVSCGANSCGYVLTYTHTCFANGCGESVAVSGSCPECSPGDTQSASCSPGGDLCGTQSRSCTSSCGWGAWGACEAYACPPAPPPPPDDPTPPQPPPPEPPTEPQPPVDPGPPHPPPSPG